VVSGLVVRFALGGVAAAGVLLVSRRILGVRETFPELLQVPLPRRLLPS
jgi:hypothetical protein